MHIDITKGEAKVTAEPAYNTILLHWGTRYTRELEYKKQVALLNILESTETDKDSQISKCNNLYDRLILQTRIRSFAIRVKNKILRTIGFKK